jgi:hypothetical protein
MTQKKIHPSLNYFSQVFGHIDKKLMNSEAWYQRSGAIPVTVAQKHFELGCGNKCGRVWKSD